MITRNVVGGAATIVIGTVYLNFAYQLRVSSLADNFGPQGLPLIYGWLTVGLGFVLVIQSIIGALALDIQERAALARSEWSGQGRQILRAAGLLLIAVVYLLLLSQLGYLVSLGLMIGSIALYMGAAPGWRIPAVSIVGAVLLWLIFVQLLDVDMPKAAFMGLFS